MEAFLSDLACPWAAINKTMTFMKHSSTNPYSVPVEDSSASINIHVAVMMNT